MQPFSFFFDSLKSLREEPYFDRGILPSEAFAFISFCKSFNVDLIIESGTAFGHSTFLFAKYLGIPVYTIDNISLYGDHAQSIAKNRCSSYDVTFIEGDSVEIIPQLIKNNPTKKIAVFIDGPKGNTAHQLRKSIWHNSNVVICALHDTEGKNQAYNFSSINNDEFQEKYSLFLDDKSLESPYPDNPSITLKQRFPRGMGIDIHYKSRNIIYAVYTGGISELYRDFYESVIQHCSELYFYILTTDHTAIPHSHIRIPFLESELGAIVGPKICALKRAPFLLGDNVLITDTDLYFNENAFKIFDSDFDIALTSRNYNSTAIARYSPINGGVWASKINDKVRHLFEWMNNEIIQPTYPPFLQYKSNHPFDKKTGVHQWWVDQDLLNVIYKHNPFNLKIIDIGPYYNWIVSEDEFPKLKDTQYGILHRKSGSTSRWKNN